MVYGDTNSTAGALAAGSFRNTRRGYGAYIFLTWLCQKNRIESSQITFRACSSALSDASIENLENEGITKGVQNRDVMCDAVLYYSKEIDNAASTSKIFTTYSVSVGELNKWHLSTVHRAENADTLEKVRTILSI